MDKSTYSSLDRAQLGGWCQFHSWLGTEVASKAEFRYHVFRFALALQTHMDATLQPARRIIARLLEADARFFREYHYLNPLRVDPSDQVEL
jgi:hypothetical protein